MGTGIGIGVREEIILMVMGGGRVTSSTLSSSLPFSTKEPIHSIPPSKNMNQNPIPTSSADSIPSSISTFSVNETSSKQEDSLHPFKIGEKRNHQEESLAFPSNMGEKHSKSPKKKGTQVTSSSSTSLCPSIPLTTSTSPFKSTLLSRKGSEPRFWKSLERLLMNEFGEPGKEEATQVFLEFKKSYQDLMKAQKLKLNGNEVINK